MKESHIFIVLFLRKFSLYKFVNDFILYIGYQSFHLNGNKVINVYNVIAKKPNKNPIIFPTAVILPWYKLLASGINSPRNNI